MALSYKPLRLTLADKNMSRGKLAAAAGVSRRAMGHIYRGEPVSLEVIDRICTALDCPIHEVVEHVPDT